MKMPSGWVGEESQQRMIDHDARLYAPLPLWAIMASLSGGGEPQHYMTQCRDVEGRTEWRAVWLVGSLLVYGSIGKSEDQWSAYSHDDAPDDMQPEKVDAWARPVREIARLQLADVVVKHPKSYSENGREWLWSAAAEIVFADGVTVSLPPFGETSTDDIDRAVQDFLDAITGLLE